MREGMGAECTAAECESAAVSIRFRIETALGRLRATITTTPDVIPLTAILPVARSLDNALVQMGVRHQEACGGRVSCSRGCDACCYHLVAVTPIEAFDLLDEVEALPVERRTEVEGRFTEAKARVQAAGLADPLERAVRDEPVEVGYEYLALGIPCPFLEDHVCSLYEKRPFACREYLVSTDPRLCDSPRPGLVEPLFVPVDMVHAVGQLSRLAGGGPRRIPLIWALDWARAHPELREQGAPGTKLFPALLDLIEQSAPTIEEVES